MLDLEVRARKGRFPQGSNQPRVNFRRQERFPFTLYGLASLLPPLALPSPGSQCPTCQLSCPGDLGTPVQGEVLSTGCRAALSSPSPPGTPQHCWGFSLPAVLPSISTNQPLSRGAPAPPLHQVISSQAQERQQESTCDQGDQGLLRKVLVVPHAPLFKCFYSKLERTPKRARTLTNRKHVHLLNRHQPQNNAALLLLVKPHVNKAGLCYPSS